MASVDNHMLISVKRKFDENGVRIASVIAKCEKLDKNGDKLLHSDDVEEVLHSCLNKYRLSSREIHFIMGSIMHDRRRGTVEYLRLFDLLEKPKEMELEDEREIWRDPVAVESESFRQGSIGDFLQRAACPAEIKNFKKFIASMERFERESGMRILPSEDGFVVPLGPDMRASVKFYQQR